MYCIGKVSSDIYYVGSSDRRLALFENVFPIPNGVSYNSYLVMDEKTVLIDTVDKSVSSVFLENVEHILDGKNLDYLIVNHMEPDHAATIGELKLRHPETQIIATKRAIDMIAQFFDSSLTALAHAVTEGEQLKTGKHVFTFVTAPMVHWPEVMVTYDMTNKILFSADSFGTFGALSGNIFADEYDFETQWVDEARRYYTNIVGKYGIQVQALLKKASALDIAMICPLHGPIWRKNISWFVEKYSKWSSYAPEENAVMIAYASIYGSTENAVNILARKLADSGIRNIAVYDVSSVHPSVIVSEAFRCSHLIFASSTYNAGIFTNMETVLLDLKAHNLQNRTVAVIENGSWAATSGTLVKNILSSMKNITILEQTVSLKSAVKKDDIEAIEKLASAISSSLEKSSQEKGRVENSKVSSAVDISSNSDLIDKKALYNISYGLFVLTSSYNSLNTGDTSSSAMSSKTGPSNSKDNGCILNTLCQVADNPLCVTIAVNKKNYTNELIQKSGIFNVSFISENATMDLFKRFGFATGRETDKFENFEDVARSENGLLYITKNTNAFLSAKVNQTIDLGSHWLYIANVTQAQKLSDDRPCTYSYYLSNIKPKPIESSPNAEKKTGWVCKICGYIHESEELPPDFICPICKHDASAFEKIK